MYLLHKKRKGITLIETLVSVAILTTAIAMPMTIASRSLSLASFAKEQVVASYLASDAVEYVMAKKRQNIIEDIVLGSGADWLSGLFTACDYPNGCTIDTTYALDDDSAIDSCSGICPNIFYDTDTSVYSYDTGSPSPFKRTIIIKEIVDGEAILEVTISWQRALLTKTFTIKTNIYETAL